MRTTFVTMAIIWAVTFVAYISGYYEPSGYSVGVTMLFTAVACVLLAFTIDVTETTSATYEITAGTVEVDGDIVHVAEIMKPDGVIITISGDSAEDVQRKAIEYIEKGGE